MSEMKRAREMKGPGCGLLMSAELLNFVGGQQYVQEEQLTRSILLDYLKQKGV
jgi:hypothetical protein